MNTAALTSIVHSRGFAVTVALIVVAVLAVFFFSGHTLPLTGDNGIALPSPNSWLSSPLLSFLAAILCAGATALIMSLMTKIYNVLRSMSALFIAYFALMQAATPDLATQFYSGNLLAAVVPAAMLLMFSCYRNPDATRRIFLIFFVLSALMLTQYCYTFYIPAMFVTLWQMSVFSRRTLLAALIGLLTPWILVLGYGFVSPGDIHMPHMHPIFDEIDFSNTLLLILTLTFTVFIALLGYVLNMFKTIAYNARARAFNNTFVIMAVITVLAMCVDYRNVSSYIPMLNFCAAMEVAHYFATHRGDRSFVAVFTIIAVYAAFFVCQTAI